MTANFRPLPSPRQIDPHLRRTLELLNRRIQSAQTNGLGFTAENKSGLTLTKGMAIANHSSGTGIVKANATDTTLQCVGLALETMLSAVSGNVQTEGLIELSDWSTVIGAVALSAKTKYFLSTTSGMLTSTPPTGAGQIVQVVGVAVNPTTLDISIQDRIKLG